MHTTVTWKTTVSRPKNWAEDPTNSQKKIWKKLVADGLKDPKTSLERNRVAHNAFSCYDTIARGTATNSQKILISVFVQNGASICSRNRSLSGRRWFLLVKQWCASPATELIEFFEEMERDFLKKTQKNWVRTNDHLFLVCNTIGWTEIAC